MENLSTELRILASLLNAPDMDAKEAVLELAAHYPWLQPVADELEELPLTDWQAEYQRLFAGGDSQSPCPPYESAYLVGPAPEVRAKTRALRDLYRRLGILPGGGPADFLGNLLECAAHLSADREAGRPYWSELWNGHLARWVPRYCRDLQVATHMVLYRIVAEHLCELFPEIREYMAEVA